MKELIIGALIAVFWLLIGWLISRTRFVQEAEKEAKEEEQRERECTCFVLDNKDPSEE